ncbi:ribonuclease BN [Haladaptatus sp. W1]|uniref:YhjD/YihY/BrkB family envelope integrity protein n=1 Tax=Haladaptatus sp. W1 TaxID=1897478 RepID=UPI000849B949|nr:YhjD/YihY/BrkB family envelope integrity protein [Haladaptatus sp. W1]ODR81879.1 ribonuclease BN [Haladaptatus sp. W1]
MVTIDGVTETGKRVVSDFSEKNVTLMAAGIAYNAFVSLAPVLLLLLIVVGIVGGGLEDRILEIAGGSLPSPIANVIERVFRSNASASGASLIGLVVLVWGSLKIFRGLDTAFSEIYDTEAGNSFLDQVKDALVVLVALTVAIIATVVVSAVFSAFADTVPYLGLLTPLVLVAGLILAFFPMYYVFPDAELEWKQVLPGTVFAAVGWAALQALFQVYLASKGSSSASLFGGVIVVITWLYFSGLVLLLGAVINAVLGGYSGAGEEAVDGIEREASLTRDELADYLRDLREGVTGRYERMRPAATDDRDEFSRPAGRIDLSEGEVSTDDGTERFVTLRWRVPEDETDAEPVIPDGNDSA